MTIRWKLTTPVLSCRQDSAQISDGVQPRLRQPNFPPRKMVRAVLKLHPRWCRSACPTPQSANHCSHRLGLLGEAADLLNGEGTGVRTYRTCNRERPSPEHLKRAGKGGGLPHRNPRVVKLWRRRRTRLIQRQPTKKASNRNGGGCRWIPFGTDFLCEPAHA